MLREDVKSSDERDKNEFKNLIFAQAFANQNRELFYTLYPEHKPENIAHNPEDWTVPRTTEELEAMMAEFQVQSIH